MAVHGFTQKTVYGIFGDPVEHSLSPLMHNEWFNRLGMEAIYHPFRIKPALLSSAVKGIRALGIMGVNITVPFKNNVAPFLDHLEGDAKLTGSVNTIVNQDGILTGYSTDGLGLLRSLKAEVNWEPEGNTVALLGTGGASTAIAFRMVMDGVSQLLIVGRSLEKAQALAHEVQGKTGVLPNTACYNDPELMMLITEMSLVINTTPLGMSPNIQDKPPLPPSWTRPDAIICDLIYNPLETEWIREASAIGRRTLSGLGMLIYQGAEAFRLWRNVEPPIEGIKSLLLKRLQ